ncbi:hypothetical protein OnM2_019010 [Erysiphe neolycopersici]|uniref:Prokaryotic-type class I peptide chain release factors domain-containing protein n=1 Tax=Erysiphe neolycopersici TaxID=212602 RepID=A0A420I3Z0_9PEZI|nr:hypothetical protein OnM2_019010 [Erysiphe neolycopersici]
MAMKHEVNFMLSKVSSGYKVLRFSPTSLLLARKSLCLSHILHFATHLDHCNLEADIDDARDWFSKFKSDSLPDKIAKTTFSRASGPGGQKTNKTSSKATTLWPIKSLFQHIPRALHADLMKSRYFVSSTQSILIKCDTHRSQASNTAETHKRLFQELTEIYHKRIPGITTLEQKKRVQKL